jgi:hypothetical protein
MNEEQLLEFWRLHKDQVVMISTWGIEYPIELQDLFKLFKLLLNKEVVNG